MAWKVAAEAKSFEDLELLIQNQELPKGTKIRAELDLKVPVSSIFDAWGAEIAFQPFIPEGVDLIDVHSDGVSKGIVEMEADPVWLLALVGFVQAHWLAIMIGGVILTTVLLAVKILVDIVVSVAESINTLAILLIAGAGILMLTKRKNRGR